MSCKYDVISLEGSIKSTEGLRVIGVLAEIRMGHLRNEVRIVTA
jgi:hypothetical protein